MADHPSTIGTLVADPKYGERGVLLRQTKDTVLYEQGQYSLDEVTEVYLKRVDWEQVGRAYTNSDVSPVVNSYSFSETNSMCKERETSFSSGIGGVIKGIGINLGTEYKTITSDFSSTTNSQTVQYTVQPGETVYHYVKAYKLTVRKWWLVDLHGQANQVVTQDHSLNSTHLGIREGIIYREKRISTTRLSGSEVLPVGQIARSWSDEHGGNARIKHRDLPSAVLSVIKDRHQKMYVLSSITHHSRIDWFLRIS
ncbi:hypothetical protein RHS04_02013 [Rhizoctonia solani]|uniref:Uncharacterized protein n=1 Tax=Rhizoctonia solani TaxID=456999 RepID=A0A8H7HEG8_9AGAM|nr:hypothetical protein RHS04_02013 [Rhizoctonia solani]